MTTPPPTFPDPLLRQALARRAAGARTSAELVDDVLAAVAHLPQRRGWTRQPAPEQRFLTIPLVAALLLSALVGFALAIGGRPPPPPGIGPASNGLIAFELSGDIVLADPVSGESRTLHSGSRDRQPSWSMDGTRIAFNADSAGPDDPGGWFVVRADGSHLVRIHPVAGSPTHTHDGIESAAPLFYAVGWSPDGSKFLLSADPGDGGGVWVAKTDGSGMERLRCPTPPTSRPGCPTAGGS
jgi:hypothetical protein